MKEGGGCTNACICMGTHSQPLLQNRLMDVYKTWQGWSNHGLAHAYRLFRQIRPEVEPRRRKNGSMRGPFSKGLLLQIRMQRQQTECILVSWIEISWLFAVHTDFTNLTVMLSDLLRNLTFNRSAHCTQVSDQCPLGLLFFFSLTCDKKDLNEFSFHTVIMKLVCFISYIYWVVLHEKQYIVTFNILSKISFGSPEC